MTECGTACRIRYFIRKKNLFLLEMIAGFCYNRDMEKRLGKKQKYILWGILTPVLALVSAFLILCFVTMGMFSPTYLGRVLTHWDSDVSDYKIFPERMIEKSEAPYVYAKEEDPSIGGISVRESDRFRTLNELVENTKTTSFLIVKNDKIVYEKYANGYDENSVNTSFSMAKSVVSLLVGKAIEEGHIQSVEQPISDFIHEFSDKEIGKTTIEDLLLMRSEIVYDEDKFLWFGDDSLTYWHNDLRKLALSHTELTDEYQGRFHYNNYHPLLLGIILERATGVSVSEFFGREIWQKIGAECDASWSLDDEDGFEKMESGINFRAKDFLKIGSMVLHGGFWNGEQIIDGDWLKKSTLCVFPIDADEYAGTFLEGRNVGYQYMWYSTPSNDSSGYDIVAWGKSDQILYISPSNDTIILRTGKTDGGVSDWVGVLKELTGAIK